MLESARPGASASGKDLQDRRDALALRSAGNPAGAPEPVAPQIDPGLAALLEQAALNPHRDGFAHAVGRMRATGVTVEEIADRYIPQVARSLGEAWCEDEIGFVDVTIATSRLQLLLRQLGPEWIADRDADKSFPALIVVVGADAYHTLGSTVVVGQLRRMGFAVKHLVEAEPDGLGQMLREAQFAAVLISASRGENVDCLRRLVRAAKSAVVVPPPVVIGGTILDAVADIGLRTGADLATCDLQEALAFCGLSVHPHHVSPRGPRA